MCRKFESTQLNKKREKKKTEELKLEQINTWNRSIKEQDKVYMDESYDHGSSLSLLSNSIPTNAI